MTTSIRLFIVIATLFLSACANQMIHDVRIDGVTQPALVEANDTVQVQFVDGVEQDVVFIGQQHLYRVAPGMHRFVVIYSDIVYGNDDSHQKISSHPVTLSFSVSAGKKYAIRHRPQPTLDEKKRFAKDPQFQVVEVDSGVAVSADSKVLEVGRFFSPNRSEEAVSVQLKSLWERASREEREAFLEWTKIAP